MVMVGTAFRLSLTDQYQFVSRNIIAFFIMPEQVVNGQIKRKPLYTF